SADTVGRAVAWLQSHGLLGLVSPGTTDALRPGVLYAGTGNLAAVYVLTVHQRRSRTACRVAGQGEFADLTGARRDPVKGPRARHAKNPKTSKARATRGLILLSRRSTGPQRMVPENRNEGLRAATVIQNRCVWLRELSAEQVYRLARPYWACARPWTV